MKLFDARLITGVRDTSPPTPMVRKIERRRKPAKYDHRQMILDRISGMSWSDVGVKHGVIAGDQRIGVRARRLALESRAASEMSTAMVAALAEAETRRHAFE